MVHAASARCHDGGGEGQGDGECRCEPKPAAEHEQFLSVDTFGTESSFDLDLRLHGTIFGVVSVLLPALPNYLGT